MPTLQSPTSHNEHNGSLSPGRPSVELSFSGATPHVIFVDFNTRSEARQGSLFYKSISHLLYLTVEEPPSGLVIYRSYRHNAKASTFTKRRKIGLAAPHPAPSLLSLSSLPLPLTTLPSHSQYHPKRPHPEACRFAHQASTAYPSLLRLASRIS